VIALTSERKFENIVNLGGEFLW